MAKKRWHDWKYWRKYHPDHEIVDKGKIVIKKIGNTYSMSLTITLRFKNNDDEEVMTIDCKEILLNIDSPQMKGRKKSYPLTYSTGETTWRIYPLKTMERSEYSLTGFSPVEPRLGKTARCQVEMLGFATLKGIIKPMKVDSFNVEVDRSEIETLDSHKEGSQS